MTGLCTGVAPFMGAWIEMGKSSSGSARWGWSLPSRERGLKFFDRVAGLARVGIAPFTGAWIEIGVAWPLLVDGSCRSLHGSMD